MPKNKNKQARFKPIVFEIQKARFKKIIGNQLKNIYSFSERSILNGVYIRVDGNQLTFASTDAHTLLKTELTIEGVSGCKHELVLNGLHLSKVKILKSYENSREKAYRAFDTLLITLNEDFAVIEDRLNGVKYHIPALTGDKFPDFDNIIPDTSKKKYTKVAFNTSFLARFASLSSSKDRIGILRVNKDDPLKCFIITSDDKEDGVKSTALIMPIQLRE